MSDNALCVTYDPDVLTEGRHSTTQRGTMARAGRDRGAVLVEFAIVVPLLLVMLFGIIDFGSLYNDYLAVRQGAREGARRAAVDTQPGPPGGGAWAEGTNCTTTGVTTSGDAYDLICYTKDRLGLSEANTRVSIYFTPGSYNEGNGVAVCVQYPANSLTGFMAPFVSNHTLFSKVEIRIEQTSNTLLTPVAETPLGGSWPATCTQV